MNRNRKKAKGSLMKLHVYTHAQALALVPYAASILRSMREHRLEANQYEQIARKLSEKPGRPDKETLLAQENATREATRAETAFNEAQEELHRLDVYSLDVVSGLALVPFAHDKQLAWFVYDLFDPQPLRFWRYQSDPLETRRLVTSGVRGGDASTLAV